MSRNSKKGFKKLETHELASFHGGESGSESELLDLAVEQEPAGKSCCWWCSCLYLGLLTCLLLLLGAFTAYVAINVRELSDDTSRAHSTLDSRIDGLKSGLDSLKSYCDNHFLMFDKRLEILNSSLQAIEKASTKNHTHVLGMAEGLQSSLHELDTRLKVIESKPQETLIRQVKAIHQEMGILNHSMLLLNHSLADVAEIKARMASMGSEIDRYDTQLRNVNRNIGDLQSSHKELSGGVDQLKSDVAGVKTGIDQTHDSITATLDQLQQSSGLLSAEFSNLQVLVSAMNDSLREDVRELWENVTEIESGLTTVKGSVTKVKEELQSHTAQIMDLLDEAKSSPKITPPPSTHPSTPPPSTSPPSTSPPSTPPPSTSPPSTPPPSTSPPSTPPPAEAEQSTAAPTTASLATPAASEEVAASGQTTVTASPTPEGSGSIATQLNLPSDSTERSHSNTDTATTTAPLKPTGEPFTSGADSTASTGASEDIPLKGHSGTGQNETTSTEIDVNSTPSSPSDSTSATEDHPAVSPPLSITHSVLGAQNTTNTTNTSTQGVERTSSSEITENGTASTEAETSNGQQTASVVLQRLLKNFDRLDLDGDGRLDATEFSQYLPGVSQVFDMLDLDRDSFITPDEIDNMLKRLEAKQEEGTVPTAGDLENGADSVYTANGFDNTVDNDSENDGNF